VRGRTPVSIQIGRIVQHLFAEDSFLQPAEDGLRVGALLRVGFGNRREEFLLGEVHGRVVLELVVDAHGFRQRLERPGLDRLGEIGVDQLLVDDELLLAGFFRHPVDARDDLLDRRVRLGERFDDLRLAHFLRAGFDHHDAVVAPGDDEVELAFLALCEGRVDHVLAVQEADADAGNRLLERNLGQRQRGGGARQGEHVGVVVGVGRQHQRDDLRLVTPAGREERTDRPVDQAAREDFLLRGLAFALEEPAGDASRRVRVLAVVDRERKEIDALARVRRAARGNEDHRVAVADDDGAVRLLGELAGFDTKRLAVDGDFACSHKSLS